MRSLKSSIIAEFIKIKHSHIWIVMVTLPSISVLIGCANFSMNIGVLQKEWYSLWSQVGLFYGEFFLPILIGICCAYLCRLEHLNRNWNMTMTTPVPIGNVFLSKLIMAGIISFFIQGLFFTLYYLSGKLIGLNSPFPIEIYGWFIRGWLASLTISTIQLALSIRMKSFAVPIGIGLCFSFIGLGLYVVKLGMIFPYSLLSIGMGIISQQSISGIQWIIFFVVNLFYIVLISRVTIRRMKKIDVVV